MTSIPVAEQRLIHGFDVLKDKTSVAEACAGGVNLELQLVRAPSPFDGKWARSEMEAHYNHFYVIQGDGVTYHSQSWKFADLGEGECRIEDKQGRTQTGKLASDGKSIKWSDFTDPKARFGIVTYGDVWHCERNVVTGKLYGDCDCGDHYGAPHKYPTCPKCGKLLPEHNGD
eukprot:gnl/TRDRNA2_/TRDRNA2_95048_c0_seq1.p1 gnl/TRDRNA2_/TRDRNA2_95048_c0~~gnl/TRDRNA2_/TRDRNA2_95048_c0_seq1.p1  ORF type:complete len:172 (-),score=17.92 gnl/TRDRNA2_/TRDRNA2_95048_c0_seq1:134-649(-)